MKDYIKPALSVLIVVVSVYILYGQQIVKNTQSGPCQNFDTLTVGGLVAEQLGGYWTTWSGNPGGPEDATVSNTFSYSPNNSFIVNSPSVDLFFQFADDPISTGDWTYSHYMYVPTGYSGYFNIQSEPTPGMEWVLEAFFDDGGTGHFTVDGDDTYFSYTQDNWFNVKVFFSLDIDIGEVMFDNLVVLNFTTSYTIGGVDYYGANNGGPPGAYYDDVCFPYNIWTFYPPQEFAATVSSNNVILTWYPPPCTSPIGYNIYRNGVNIDFIVPTYYVDEGLDPGTYNYCVTAVYEGEESSQVCVTVVIEPIPPKTFTIPDNYFMFGDTIPMIWCPPDYNTFLSNWIHWDAGENGDNGIGGITSPMYCASSWQPSDLIDMDGKYLTKISYYHYDNAPSSTFTLKVWQGAFGGTLMLSQEVLSSISGEWNEITLDNPVQIDASQGLLFGYEVTINNFEYPAGVDDGPAIKYKGDMISFDGSSWASMSADYGLDYNWNIAGYVSDSPGDKEVAKPMVKPINSFKPGKINMTSGVKGGFSKFSPTANTELSYYKVYRNGDSIGTTTDTIYYDVDYPAWSLWYSYYVTAVYNNSIESGPSNADTAFFATGINELRLSSIQIYPNPVSDLVTINSKMQIQKIKLFTYTGQLILDSDVKDYNFKIDMSEFEKGIYLIKIETENGVIVRQIIKN